LTLPTQALGTLFGLSAEARLTETLKKRGVSAEILEDAARELHTA
jgi:hypothetical protein